MSIMSASPEVRQRVETMHCDFAATAIYVTKLRIEMVASEQQDYHGGFAI